MQRARPPSECPVCGADVPPAATACPECGADERTGWNEEATRYDGIDLPEESFGDSEAAPARSPAPRSPTGLSRFWWLVGIGLLAALAYLSLRPLLGS